MTFNWQKFRGYILAVLFVAAVLVWVAVFQSGLAFQGQLASVSGNIEGQEKLEVTFFDIGQGAAVFVEATNGNQMLIDGGPGSQILNKLGEEMPFFDRHIDVVMLTHPDSDHLNGLIDVLKRYEVGQVVEPCLAESGANYQEWLGLIEEKEIPRLCAKIGQRIKLAEDVEVDILYPFESLEGVSLANTNDGSVVAKLIYGDSKIMLTGDAEQKTEYQLAHSGLDLQAQVLQVGHHGSKTSSTDEFLKAVEPEVAVIQAGRNNRYGHPAEEALERLRWMLVLRTDLEQKDIKFVCNLENCNFK